MPPFGGTYVDGELIVHSAATAEQIELDTPRVLAAITEAFEHYGLRINWEPGETAVILLLRRAGAQQV